LGGSWRADWLLLICQWKGNRFLISTGGEPAALLHGSRLVSEQIETLDANREPLSSLLIQRTLAKLHGKDWIASGTAAMSFDRCREENRAAVRESILAARLYGRSCVRQCRQVLAEFSLRMRLGCLRHLEMCRTFYQVESKNPFWSRELAMLDDGIPGYEKKSASSRRRG